MTGIINTVGANAKYTEYARHGNLITIQKKIANMINLHLDERNIQQGFIDILAAGKIAAKNTLNKCAFLTRKNAIQNIKDKFINRNDFTTRQIQVQSVNSTDINTMFSEVGATEKAGYMELQETGGSKKPKRGSSMAIPQISTARRGSKRNLVSRQLYLKELKKNSIKGRVKNQKTYTSKLVARMFMAKKLNKVIAYNKGIFKITGFVKNKNSIHFTKKLIYSTGHKSISVKSKKWFAPAYKKPMEDIQNIYDSEIIKLLRGKDII
jgi:hypothetical protein